MACCRIGGKRLVGTTGLARPRGGAVADAKVGSKKGNQLKVAVGRTRKPPERVRTIKGSRGRVLEYSLCAAESRRWDVPN